MDECPPLSPSCSADPSRFVVPVVICLVPRWSQCPEQGRWSQPGEACLFPGARGGPGTQACAELAPREASPQAQCHVMKRMLLPPRTPSASAGCSALLSLHALRSPPPLFPAPSFLQFLSVIVVGTGATLPQATLMWCCPLGPRNPRFRSISGQAHVTCPFSTEMVTKQNIFF